MKAAGRILLCLLLSLLFVSNGCTSQAQNQNTVSTADTSAITLTQAEKDFIQAHPVINLGVDPKFIPYEFIDTDGEYKGIAADYIKLICQKTGLQMVVAKDLIWTVAYEKAVNKELDVLPCVSKTAEREKYFLYSDSYYTFQRAIYINHDNTTIQSFDDLSGTTVAVQTNSSHNSYLATFPSINLSLYTTVEEALQAVSDGKETSFVGNFATSNYLIKTNGITNLKYIKMNTQEPQSLYFAVRNDWPELVSILNKALSSIDNEEKITINNKWIGVDNSVQYTELIRNLEIAGAVAGIILIVSIFWIIRLRKEIAIRKKTQDELHAAKEEAERANQIKSLFLARMSHEIRTPLNAVMGMSYLIKKTDMTTTQNIYLDKLTQAAKNMLGIINDILDFSKIEAGKIEIENISFDLDKVLQRVISIASIKVEEQGIDFAMEKDPVMPTFFFGDPMRIEQILLNLLNNAIKFTEEGMVSLQIRVLSKTDSNCKIEFCVKDSGIGMSPEQVSRIFMPFDQGDSSINRRFGGTGLGLSIVKNLTDLMGGEVAVESEAGKGSAFYIRLPLIADITKDEAKEKKMAADCFRGVRALVLDKNENTRAILANCFASFGIAAEFASSEEEALKLIHIAVEEKDLPHNLIVVDYAAPKEDGIKFLHMIINLQLFKKPPKSMLIIPLGREDLYDGIEAAGIDFGITKPIIPSVIYNAVIESFKIEPPVMPASSKAQGERKSPYQYHILLVEDNKTNQFIAQTILEQSGFRISKADNGEQGYLFFKENQTGLDLILMDIHMPVMDGYTASDLIRKTDKDIPIIAMTADAIAGVREQCKAHGLKHYVSKPFEPEQLIETILDVLKDKKPALYTETSAEPPASAMAPAEAQAAAPAEPVQNPVPSSDEPLQNPVPPSDEPVLDAAFGLKLIGGDTSLYQMILQVFHDENNMVAADLNAKISAKDYAGAVQIVHKTKSSAGNIGAHSLYDAAAELQKTLRDADESVIPGQYSIFTDKLRRLLLEIEDILNSK